MRIVAILLLLSCATIEWEVPEKVALRRRATARLEQCLEEPPFEPLSTKPCLQESRQWCMERGLEPACAVDGMFGKSRSEYHKRK